MGNFVLHQQFSVGSHFFPTNIEKVFNYCRTLSRKVLYFQLFPMSLAYFILYIWFFKNVLISLVFLLLLDHRMLLKLFHFKKIRFPFQKIERKFGFLSLWKILNQINLIRNLLFMKIKIWNQGYFPLLWHFEFFL
jgi:hypothetical protein